MYLTNDECIRRLSGGGYTEGYETEEFRSHPGFRVVWEWSDTPASQDRSWERLLFLNSSEEVRELHQVEAYELLLLWKKALSHQGKGWTVRDIGNGVFLVPATHIGGSGRDRGVTTATPDCSPKEAIDQINGWFLNQSLIDWFYK